MNNGTTEHAAFVDELTRFHSQRGTTLKIPKFNRSPLDLEKLWEAVRKNGGSNKVCEMKHWAQIGRIFGGTTADKNVSNNIKRAFTKWLLPYEREHYPDDAMSSSGEHTVPSTPRRKRPQSCQTLHEKKPRPAQTIKKEEQREQQVVPIVAEHLHQDLPSAITLAQPCAPIETMPSTPRSFVSIPHLTEAKYYIILLPPAAAQELNGMDPGRASMEALSQGVDQQMPTSSGVSDEMQGVVHQRNRTNGQGIEPPKTVGDQFRVSLLLNQSKSVTAETPPALLPNIVVLQQDPQNEPITSNDAQGSASTAVQETLDEQRCEGQASTMKRVPCSGLLCLIDHGIPENNT